MKDGPVTKESEALRTLTSLVGKLAKVEKRLRRGTAQHTLAVRRLKALRFALTLLRKEMRTKRTGSG